MIARLIAFFAVLYALGFALYAVTLGDPATVLAERASEASLLVLSGRDVAARLAGRFSVPFLVYRQLAHPPTVELPRPVLLGVSGAPGSDRPVEFAFAEAALRGAPLLAMHVWSASAGAAAGPSAPRGGRQ